MPKNWDILLLGYSFNYDLGVEKIINTLKVEKIKNFNIGIPLKMAEGTYGYLISTSGANKLLELNNKIFIAIDALTGSYKYLNTYVLEPRIVSINNSFGSNIEDERKILRKKYGFLKQLLIKRGVFKAVKIFHMKYIKVIFQKTIKQKILINRYLKFKNR